MLKDHRIQSHFRDACSRGRQRNGTHWTVWNSDSVFHSLETQHSIISASWQISAVAPHRRKLGQPLSPVCLFQFVLGKGTYSIEDESNLSIHGDHTLCRASVLPKQSLGLLGTILDGSPLRCRILEWLNHPSKLVLILPTSEGWQAESTPPRINSTAERDLNSGPEDPEPATRVEW